MIDQYSDRGGFGHRDTIHVSPMPVPGRCVAAPAHPQVGLYGGSTIGAVRPPRLATHGAPAATTHRDIDAAAGRECVGDGAHPAQPRSLWSGDMVIVEL